jgi:para-aminobenzoate synthetase/4-amino-4-deoxychorismate lyase
MKVISELESTRRELYTGAIGLVSPIAGLDMSVAIRTFEIAGEHVWFGAGGGIVADSDAELELAEALVKARGPVQAVGGEVAVRGATARASGGAVPRALAHGARPDPAGGIFETILSVDRVPVLLEEHLARLASSSLALYDLALDLDELAAQAQQYCAQAGIGRVRLRVLMSPDGGVAFDTTAATDRTQLGELRLKPFVLPGGLGEHKWRDRALLDALAASAPAAAPLIVDSDGAVLEAAHANVWLIEGERLLTPPADGRLLPGVTRAELLRSEPHADEEELNLERMMRADGIFVTSSIAGRRTARLS